MSPTAASWQGLSPGGKASLPPENRVVGSREDLAGVGKYSTISTQLGAPVVRNFLRPVAQMLRVREIAQVLGVSTATVYALVERGELERVWVGASMRVPNESLKAFVERNRR